MTVEILKNGGEHECDDVNQVIAKLDALKQSGDYGYSLLVDIRKLSVLDHPKANMVADTQKTDLKNLGLLEATGQPSQLVKDVVLSTTYEDGLRLKYTGAPYINDHPDHVCLTRTILHYVFPFLKKFSPERATQ